MCGSMVDMHFATAENRRGKKEEEERRQKPQLQNIMSASATQGDHNKKMHKSHYRTVHEVTTICNEL